MLHSLLQWFRSIASPLAAVELFAWSNLAFLAVDVFIAHSMNAFEDSAEWIPVAFSLVAPLVLVVAMVLQRSVSPTTSGAGRLRLARWIGLVIGGGSVLVGVAGLLWHLESRFFVEFTIESLIYTAPFIAPLSYAGVGFLLLLNRMIDARSRDWARWVLLLALGGFLGNFILSLADHAQNGFFEWREWIPVVAAAIAVANLASVIFIDQSREWLQRSALIMLAQIAVGVLGCWYHARALTASPMDSLWEKLIYGAPLFAPLLFADLALLALVGLWSLRPSHVPVPAAGD